MTFDKTLSADTPEPKWAGQIEQCVFGTGNGWFDEIVFFHRASGTVIFTDLIMDFDPATFSSIAQATTRWNQMYRHTPLGIQLAHTLNRSTLRNALQTIRAWQPERAIVAHSPWLCMEGKQQVADFLDSAFDWLAPQPAIVESVMTIVRLLILFIIVLPIHVLIVLIADIITPKLINWSGSK
ncbi:DUF4336 domain-containing protein [Leptolyngbya sp. GB1-A1]|uniref:hypothetical protein n=1 Tax=Leptolyngbya sp. GB1-A1 TaxID=2933908 RepID=UPI0032999BBE